MTDEETLKAIEDDLESPTSNLLPMLKPFLRSLIRDSRDLRAIVDALPKCMHNFPNNICGQLETHSDGFTGFCDEHSRGRTYVSELPYASVLRRMGVG